MEVAERIRKNKREKGSDKEKRKNQNREKVKGNDEGTQRGNR
jgi:hypothetical protein